MKKFRLSNLVSKFQEKNFDRTLLLSVDRIHDISQQKKKISGMKRVNTVKKYKSVLNQSQSKQFDSNNQPMKTKQMNYNKKQDQNIANNYSNNRFFKYLKENNNLPLINQSKKLSKPKKYYKHNLIKALSSIQTTYILKLFRAHFQQNLRAANMTKYLKVEPNKKIQLQKKTNHNKTIILDLDETLIHCSQGFNKNSIKLNIPIQNGRSIAAGISIRPFCKQFLLQLSQISEVIIFTASSSSYADIVIDYLDPQKKMISHRLFRQHCTFQKGFYIKDLRNINRRLEDMVIVDNSFISFCLQINNGIPIIPYFDNEKDTQLQNLLEYLKQIIVEQDVRNLNKKTFLLQKYRDSDIRNLILRSSHMN